jgi:hypothetical protein
LIIYIICFIPIILIMCVLLRNAGWLKSVGSQIVCELDHKKPALYAIPIEHILDCWVNFLLCQSVTQEQFRTTIVTSFRAHPATAGRMLAMDARCGLSTLGAWAGPVICNEWNGSSQHGEKFRQ